MEGFTVNIADTLTTGMQVELKLNDINEPTGSITLSTVIESRLEDNRYLLLTPMHKGHAYPLHKGDRLSMVFSHIEPLDHGKEHYAVNAQIIDHLKQGSQNYIIIQLVGEPLKTLRRNAFRVNLMKPAEIIQAIESRTEHYDIMVLNLSNTGLKCLSSNPFRTGDILTVKLDLNEQKPSHLNEDTPVIHEYHDSHLEHVGGVHELLGIVRGCEVHSAVKGEYKLRIEFSKLPYTTDQALTFFLLRMQSKEHALVKNRKDEQDDMHHKPFDELSQVSRTMLQFKSVLNFSMFITTLSTIIVLTTAFPSYTTNIFKVLLRLESTPGVWDFGNLALAIQFGTASGFWVLLCIGIKRFGIGTKEPLFDMMTIVVNSCLMAYMSFVYYL